ncbi:MAG: 3-methyl-2-oxobutanoate hydroxymethyltransferase [Bacillota bacterium]|nr:3-methyl-2-oxobutanoate hydroxymethyltransferase [Bacillota bacterium]
MPRKTIIDFHRMKAEKEKIVFLTAYDAMMAAFEERAGVDMILIGDSVGNTELGYSSTIPVTMEEMITCAKAVRRGAPNTFIIGDMPFMSYQASVEDAVRNAGRFVKEAECDAVKLEGGQVVAHIVKAISEAGILTMGHIGLTPQYAAKFGGWKAQGRDLRTALQLVKDARALEEASAFSILLEGMPGPVSKVITEMCEVPILGIGAGLPCDGQLLIVYDMLGMFELFRPKFVKRYGQLADEIVRMMQEYAVDVRANKFPGPEHEYRMPQDVMAEFHKALQEGKH